MKYLILLIAISLAGCGNGRCEEARYWANYYQRCVNEPGCHVDAGDLARLDSRRHEVRRYCVQPGQSDE